MTFSKQTFGQRLRTDKVLITLELFLYFGVFVTFTYVFPATATPFLVLLAFLSLKLRRLKWRDMGFFRPKNFLKTLALGFALGLGFQLGSVFLWTPLVESLTGEQLDMSQFAHVEGNLTALLIWIVVGWTLAAFGEEISSRGYLMERLAKLIGGRHAWALSLILVSLLFGASHFYQGIVGIIDTTILGFAFGASYLLTGRNLWLPIFFHGFLDTFGFLLLFYGIY